MLESKRDTDDGQCKGEPERDMTDKDPESRKDHPQEIAHKPQRARIMRFKHLPEGGNRKTGQLETLKPEGNADDREAQDQTGQKVFDGGQKTPAENRPKQIEEKIQRLVN